MVKGDSEHCTILGSNSLKSLDPIPAMSQWISSVAPAICLCGWKIGFRNDQDWYIADLGSIRLRR